MRVFQVSSVLTKRCQHRRMRSDVIAVVGAEHLYLVQTHAIVDVFRRDRPTIDGSRVDAVCGGSARRERDACRDGCGEGCNCHHTGMINRACDSIVRVTSPSRSGCMCTKNTVARANSTSRSGVTRKPCSSSQRSHRPRPQRKIRGRLMNTGVNVRCRLHRSRGSDRIRLRGSSPRSGPVRQGRGTIRSPRRLRPPAVPRARRCGR